MPQSGTWAYKAILRHYYKGASITSQGSSGGLFGWLRSCLADKMRPAAMVHGLSGFWCHVGGKKRTSKILARASQVRRNLVYYRRAERFL